MENKITALIREYESDISALRTTLLDKNMSNEYRLKAEQTIKSLRRFIADLESLLHIYSSETE